MSLKKSYFKIFFVGILSTWILETIINTNSLNLYTIGEGLVHIKKICLHAENFQRRDL